MALARAGGAGAALGAAAATEGAALGAVALADAMATVEAEGAEETAGADDGALAALDCAGEGAADAAAAGALGAALGGAADAAGLGNGVDCAALPEQAASNPPSATSAALPRTWRRVREAGMATPLRRCPKRTHYRR